jgi:hypothetical protein
MTWVQPKNFEHKIVYPLLLLGPLLHRRAATELLNIMIVNNFIILKYFFVRPSNVCVSISGTKVQPTNCVCHPLRPAPGSHHSPPTANGSRQQTIRRLGPTHFPPSLMGWPHGAPSSPLSRWRGARYTTLVDRGRYLQPSQPKSYLGST